MNLEQMAREWLVNYNLEVHCRGTDDYDVQLLTALLTRVAEDRTSLLTLEVSDV